MAESVEALLAVSQEALSRGDFVAMRCLYHPNAALPTRSGEIVIGHDAIAVLFEQALSAVPEDIDHAPTSERIHMVNQDLAIVDSVGRTFRSLPDGTNEVLSVEGFTMIAVREGGDWLWAGIRGAVVPK